MRKFGIIGYPLSHSFSPAYFAEKFLREGITDFKYDAYPLAAIEELTNLLKANPDIVGLNVTIPYKKSVLNYLDESSSVVREVGACNCIAFKNGKLIGHNTDVTGFEQSLLPHLLPHQTQALILGTGGSAIAVAYVLRKLEIPCLFVTRKLLIDPQHITYAQLTKEVLSDHTLVINTTPLGMYPNVDDYPDIPYQYLTQDHLLYDLVYNPSETRFLQKGKAQGALIKNGLEMLQIQAEESWRIWNEAVNSLK